MGVTTLLDAFDAQDDTLTLGLAFEERVKLAVDDAHSVFTQTKVEGLIRRANLRYPNADLRRLDLVEERGLDRSMLAGLGTCSFIDRQQNVVFQGFTGSGKSYLGCALAKAACRCQWPMRTARRRPAELPAGGHGNCPLMANRSAHLGVGGVGHARSSVV
nr:ATP-binding protein [Cryobacterium sp. 1639]